MKKKKGYFIFFILVLVLTACHNSLVTPAPTPLIDTNLLFILDGKVNVKRVQWSNYVSVSSYAPLYWGDQLAPSKGSNVVVLCDDLSLWIVPADIPSGVNNGCFRNNRASLNRSSGNIGETRSSNNPLIPYLISPRETKILTDKPLLRWHPIPGAKKYKVEIRGDGLDWQTETTSTEFVYPGEPVLIPGRQYLLIVEADNGRSSKEEEEVGLGFAKLSGADRDNLEKGMRKILAANLPEQESEYAIIQLYIKYGLVSEAIQRLEELMLQEPSNPRVYSALGQLYLDIGLPYLAEPHYKNALDVAKTGMDLESEAVAQEGLGNVYLSIGNTDEAKYWLGQGEASFDKLGDSEHSKLLHKIQQELSQ
jgi:hypothetical protein